MAAAIAGMLALVVRFEICARQKAGPGNRLGSCAAAASLVVFSFVITPLVAIPVYAIAGVLWSPSRAAANGHL
ncbi:hypothetical protein SAMN05216337_101050 [Bradyrhizobium brasilense]|uniref:Uncharacterized protein n=1 Tax=Bradyrhizobium brasilense TaxID=1419277 RepID=A0A1G6TXT0_9BRAD|nr:hypothetical protein [Bradyrhizobium brasilense]SDD33861.1 hypothetical protein SAMN05216337_101050 [Bradyrhizobium brasilense]